MNLSPTEERTYNLFKKSKNESMSLGYISRKLDLEISTTAFVLNKLVKYNLIRHSYGYYRYKAPKREKFTGNIEFSVDFE